MALGSAAPAVRAEPVAAQDPAAETVSVFQDCQTFGCDDDFFRRDLPFVRWVRDREAADVHVLVTSEATGGGGRRYRVAFLGQGEFAGEDLELEYVSGADATNDEVRRGLAGTLRFGVLPYLWGRDVAERLSVRYEPASPEAAAAGPSAPVDDPWNLWVFRTGLSGFFNGESSTSTQRLSGSLSAQRTTETWKLSLRGNASRRESEFTLEDRVVESVVEDWTVTGLAARSLGEHWTAGVRTSAGSSSFRNQRLAVRAAPGVEFSVFPYDESSRRELTFLYSVGANYFDYEERTIFEEVEETRFDQTLTAQLDFNQPWGEARIFTDASHYLHDLDLWRATLGGNLEIRLFKGFSVNAGGRYSWIRDQLFIPQGDATDDEILTQQQQLATNFSYFMSFGVSYTFGSVFNSVVNPRFGGGGGGGFIIF